VRQLFGDVLFTSGAQGLAGFAAKGGNSAHVYQFAYVPEAARGKEIGVGHGGEVVFVFGPRGLANVPFYAKRVKAITDADRDMVAQTQAYWTNFAKTGDPNGAGLPNWPGFSFAKPGVLVVGNDDTKAQTPFRARQLAILYGAWGRRTGIAVAP
jgi:para-nitrobenzyl esterase